jgi:hypothetical protein
MSSLESHDRLAATALQQDILTPERHEPDLLGPLLAAKPVRARDEAPAASVVGELLALGQDGSGGLVRYPGQPGSAALPARTAVDLDRRHIGHPVVLMFEGGNPTLPLIMGVLRPAHGWPAEEAADHVEVDADGARMVVSARQELTLRCGKASITLTKAGKVLIQGTYVSSRSLGVNRVNGGSVQIN